MRPSVPLFRSELLQARVATLDRVTGESLAYKGRPGGLGLRKLAGRVQDEMSQSVRVASVAELPPGTGRELTVGDRVIALFNVEGEIHALDGLCMHSGGPLAKGALRGEVITCPWHGWQFNVKTGRHCLAPRIQQPPVQVEVRGDDVFVILGDNDSDLPD